MKLTFKHLIITGLFIALAIPFGSVHQAFAEDSDSIVAIQVSPMNQKISLVPGERYYGTFKITNPNSSVYSFEYSSKVDPFYVDEAYAPVYENNGDYNQIVDWITVVNSEGIIAPNETTILQFYIDVPENAPAGGQYATIVVGSKDKEKEKSEGIALSAKYSIAHLIYAEVAGETNRGGDIDNLSVPGFLFSGNITGAATIKNTGNVHSDATYTLQIFPLFSKEEVYTNEENPDTNTIMPGTSRTTSLTWSETPSIGIFHVIYKVAFEGVESKVDKYVIVCPLWLLFLILLAIFLIIFRILSAKKKKKE